MATVFIVEFPGATAAQYDAVMADMQLSDTPPPGAIFHVAGPMDGGWRVVDVWESPEAFAQFSAAQIEPLARKHGLGAPQVTTFPAHKMLR